MKTSIVDNSLMVAGSQRHQQLTGWGRTAPTLADVRRPQRADEIATLLSQAPSRGAIPRGLGRSYGDAAQNGGGLVIETGELDGIVKFDPDQGVATGKSGLSLAALIRAVLPLGWFIPVSPGTRQVTLGGAVAADVHGKNQHRDGNFCDHVEAIELHSPARAGTITRDSDADVFAATAGGMGLTGVISTVRLQLLRVETAWMVARVRRLPNLEALLAEMTDLDDKFQYSVAWVDCRARGRNLGRAVLTLGDHARLDDLDPKKRRQDPLRYRDSTWMRVPWELPSGVLNPASLAAFNEVVYRRAPATARTGLTGIGPFFYPLDVVSGWNRVYGKRGFLQYQFVVPFGAEQVLREALDMLSQAGSPPSLSVLKRFGRKAFGHLGFPMPGWTFALDVPVGSDDLERALCSLDQSVAEAGGRVYLAKDSRLRRELLPVMYPRLAEWRAVQAELDPGGVLQSDLSRRLAMVPARG
ncbi:MAG: FAD-binding oxidoreductase [Candidatus Dormiibacterota bacterium]